MSIPYYLPSNDSAKSLSQHSFRSDRRFNEYAGAIYIETGEDQKHITLPYSDEGQGSTMRDWEDLFNSFYATKRGVQGKKGLGMY